jgi:hypothetical protein
VLDGGGGRDRGLEGAQGVAVHGVPGHDRNRAGQISTRDTRWRGWSQLPTMLG